MTIQKAKNVKIISKKDNIGELAPKVVWIYFKATIIKTVWYGAKQMFD